MDFPIIDLLDDELSIEWLMKYFHPAGFGCPHCQTEQPAARFFRVNVGSGLPVYRCGECDGIYHLYSGTVFEGSQLTPSQVVLLLRGILHGQSSAQMARELTLVLHLANDLRDGYALRKTEATQCPGEYRYGK